MAGKKMELSEAQKMIREYNVACRADDLHSLLIDADFLRKIIDQKNCRYVRFFLALDREVAKGNIGVAQGHTLVAVGADREGKNIKHGEHDTEVYEDFQPCPTVCHDGDGYTL